jgi:hypothetical protein
VGQASRFARCAAQGLSRSLRSFLGPEAVFRYRPDVSREKGGYTRIIPYKRRRGDNAELVILELTMIKEKQKAPKHKASAETAQKPKAEKPAEAQAHVEPAPPEKEKHKHEAKKPLKKPLGGLGKIFKSERDSL